FGDVEGGRLGAFLAFHRRRSSVRIDTEVYPIAILTGGGKVSRRACRRGRPSRFGRAGGRQPPEAAAGGAPPRADAPGSPTSRGIPYRRPGRRPVVETVGYEGPHLARGLPGTKLPIRFVFPCPAGAAPCPLPRRPSKRPYQTFSSPCGFSSGRSW